MQTVTLVGTELTTSVMGFGCSSLLGDQTRAEGLELLAAAFDANIRYFDVARVYGYGEAERLLGEFARGHRSQIVIATKFGIQPLVSLSRAAHLRAVVQKIMRFSPRLRTLLGRSARMAVKRSRFSVNEVRRSLETSLRALGTDYIDIYLLHDCTVRDASEELLVFLDQARRDGKIRYFGVGTGVEQIVAICGQHPQFAEVIQFQNSVLISNLRYLGEPPGAVVTHGALAGSYTALKAHLSKNPELARRWSEIVQADCGNPSILAAMMLRHAVRANQRGPVLFHSRHAESIRGNARAIAEEWFAPEQLEQFARLARDCGIRPS